MEKIERAKSSLLKQKGLINYLLSRIDEYPSDMVNFPEKFSNVLIYPWILSTQIDKVNQFLKELKTQDVPKCAFNHAPGSEFTELLVDSSQRKEGLKEIWKFTSNAESLIVIDPYMYGGKRRKATIYGEEFRKNANL